jgi:hypothetical protein
MFDQPHPAATASNPAERRWRVDLALLKSEDFLGASLPAVGPGFQFEAFLEFAYLDDFWTLAGVNPFGEPGKRREKVERDAAKIGRYLAGVPVGWATSSSSKSAIGGFRRRSFLTRRRPTAAVYASSAAIRRPVRPPTGRAPGSRLASGICFAVAPVTSNRRLRQSTPAWQKRCFHALHRGRRAPFRPPSGRATQRCKGPGPRGSANICQNCKDRANGLRGIWHKAANG